MEILRNYAIPLALGAVGIVLLLGLWNMLRGGSPNTSQLLMRWRVVLQFIALCLVMAAIYLAGAADDIPRAMEMAKESIRSGAAKAKLDAMRKATNK